MTKMKYLNVKQFSLDEIRHFLGQLTQDRKLLKCW